MNKQQSVKAAQSIHGGKHVIVENKMLQNSQKMHAIYITNVIPTLGFIGAIIFSIYYGFGLFEVVILVLMYFISVTGMEVGYHRFFTHASFKSNSFITSFLAITGSFCAMGPVIYWVANHRRHHRHSDKDGDPHSPHKSGSFLKGLWHSHIGWQYEDNAPNTAYFAKELLKNPLVFQLNKYYLVWLVLGLLIPTVIGFFIVGGWVGALSGFLWGGLARIFIVNQVTFSVTSLCHIYGKKEYDTNEESRNLAILAIPTFGQSWHNNHHAFPNSAYIGLKWWQIDIGGMIITVLKFLGLAWDIQKPKKRIK